MKLHKRELSGVLLLDKPQGITSNAALQRIKRLFNAKKAGHTGSLDPLATGMLPICFGEATKFSQYLLNADKVYHVEAQLGIKTNTGDRDGEPIQERPVPLLNSSQIEKLCQTFVGTMVQIPPMYSALKYQGRPLYELARAGKTVERDARSITIFNISQIHYENTRLTFDVHCSKGTYIRTLIEDMGEQLNCGAHVVELRRLAINSFKENQMVTEDYLKNGSAGNFSILDRTLLPVNSMLEKWPVIVLSADAYLSLTRGQLINITQQQLQPKTWVQFQLENGEFVGVGEILTNHQVAPRRLMAISQAKN